MRSWSEERLGLMALGYSRVLWVHIHCITCGLFRCGLPAEPEIYECPTCGKPSKATILTEGFTRRPLPFEPVLIVKQLSEKTRRELLVKERIVKPRRIKDWHHGQKIRKLRRASAML